MRFVLGFLLFILPFSAFSQNQAKVKLRFADSLGGFTISVCPTEMPFGYDGGYAEWTINNKFKIGLGAGHISRSKYYGFGNHDDLHPWLAYDGTFVRLSGKYFFRQKLDSRHFVEIQLTGRELMYSWLNFFDTPPGLGADEEFGFTKSENTKSVGLTFNEGFERFLAERFFIELFYGCTLNFEYRNCTQFRSWDYSGHYDDTVHNTTTLQTLFLPDIGIKLGFMVWEKKQ